MAPEGRPFVIALEEHYYDSELAATFDGPEGRAVEIRRRLDDLGELRLKEMDEAGIDVQVISHGAPSTQRLDPETAVRLAHNANDRLAQAIAVHPDRFAGLQPCQLLLLRPRLMSWNELSPRWDSREPWYMD